jgi:hypothetical protein
MAGRPRGPREQQAQLPRRSLWTRGLCRLPSRAAVPRGFVRVLSSPDAGPSHAVGRPAVHDGLIVMLPRSELAEITWAEAAALGTVTVLEPTYVCVSMA